MTLVPAYGRDYRNQKDLLKDWNDCKDFEIASIGEGCMGDKISIQQIPKGSHNIRYARLTKVLVIKVA